MNVKEAIRTAAVRVRCHHFGTDQYQVDHYDEARCAWWAGDMTSRTRALHSAWEEKVCMALELLGVEDAGAKANGAVYHEYPRDWRQVVRDEMRRRP